jgi:hypothetical protein
MAIEAKPTQAPEIPANDEKPCFPEHCFSYRLPEVKAGAKKIGKALSQ